MFPLVKIVGKCINAETPWCSREIMSPGELNLGIETGMGDGVYN